MTMANLNGQVNGSFHQGSTTPNPPLLAAHPSINNGSTMEAYAPEIEDPSTLDHALLESLFYNEMMMFNTSSPSASNFLSHHFNEATATHPTTSNAPVVASDPNTIAEKEMLRAFGVSESPLLHDPPSSRTSTNTSTNDSTTMEAWIAPAVATKTVRNAVAKFPPQSTHISIYPVPVPPATAAPLHPPPPARVAPVVASKPAAKDDAEAAAADVKPKPALSIDPPTPVSHERAKQLVDQFATLASRLGITLPPTVLQSLTTAASKNDPQTPGTATTTTTTEPTPPVQSSASPIQAEPQSPVEEERILAGPIVAELRRTAEEAIAAVSKKRPAADPEATDGTTTANENNSPGSNKPLYSKRRKKPRLSDCESRLAELKAENETLKRHLQNKYHKAHRFDQEKEEAGRRIQRLWESDAGPQEMDQAVQEFSDMYSDYGVNRQHELSFHLEQLQRLVNPTNFTKMGLWTLGQNSTNPNGNPIAGILQKELDITTQQGRKILDQSEKIRLCCENLKECLSLLAKLNSLCEQKTQIFHDRMDKCREILTSKQVVKLILWINEHTQLLETVCPGWGTEHC